ncbi:MAG: shikimate kinase [Firmicutes bacterium]|nr:shikimate kinase [Bacillota bacterium]
MISKALALVGMMGAGKSTVAKAIAIEAGCPWYDLDAEIEETVGQDVASIFQTQGEAAFRQYEAAALQRLLTTRRPPFVVATGGGTPLLEDNRRLLRSACWVAWLDAPAEVLFERAWSPTRPLTQGGWPTFEALARERRQLYESVAHGQFTVAHVSPTEVAHQIVAWWKSVGREGDIDGT